MVYYATTSQYYLKGLSGEYDALVIFIISCLDPCIVCEIKSLLLAHEACIEKNRHFAISDSFSVNVACTQPVDKSVTSTLSSTPLNVQFSSGNQVQSAHQAQPNQFLMSSAPDPTKFSVSAPVWI